VRCDVDGRAARRRTTSTASDRGGQDGGAVGEAAAARARRPGGGREGRDGAIGTPARGPDSAFNAGELTGGAHSSVFSELKITLDENSLK
jgi:hypothetical protein